MNEKKQVPQSDIEYWTTDQVVEYLGISLRTLRNRNKAKMFPYKKINNRLYYPADEIKKAIGMPMKPKKTIENVTVERLDVVLRICNIHLPKTIIDRVIDCVKLIEEKGGKATLEDVIDLQAEWDDDNMSQYELKYEYPL